MELKSWNCFYLVQLNFLGNFLRGKVEQQIFNRSEKRHSFSDAFMLSHLFFHILSYLCAINSVTGFGAKSSPNLFPKRVNKVPTTVFVVNKVTF